MPLSKCEEAASYLIKALGGEDVAKRLIGGIKWWQVRGVNGSAFAICGLEHVFLMLHSVDAQWFTAKKDWKESKRKHKLQRSKEFTDSSSPGSEAGQAKNEAAYDKDMDATRCILYFHGGDDFFFVG